MNNKQEPIKVVCGLIIKDDKFLITQRSESMRLPLKWEFPGGKLELNETEEDCLNRELLEELNIKVSIKEKLSNTIYSYIDHTVDLIPFLAEYISGSIVLNEHKEFKFVDKNELKNFDFAEADIPIIDALLSLH